jgi:hypothetical protein
MQEIIYKYNLNKLDKISLSSNKPYDKRIFLKFINYLIEKDIISSRDLLKFISNRDLKIFAEEINIIIEKYKDREKENKEVVINEV